MTDLTTTIEPKSDRTNADDLLAGPRTIKITKVMLSGEADQPVTIHFEGDNGKPYHPCKSIRRVLVHCWGGDGATYIGRSMTLYRDEKVQFGGLAVGGIRVSHLSHIKEPITLALTASRANRKPYTVRPLVTDDRPAQRQPPTFDASTWATDAISHITAALDPAALSTWFNAPTMIASRRAAHEADPDLAKSVKDAFGAKMGELMAQEGV